MPKPYHSGINSKNIWVLLRGLCREQGHWGSFPDRLCAAQNKVIMIDIPGTGKRWQSKSETTIETTMHRVRQDYKAITKSNDTKIHLIAISMGGMIATAWAEHFPQDIETLVLLNTSFKNFNAINQRLKPANIPLLFNFIIKQSPQNEQKILDQTRNLNHDPDIAIQWKRIATQHPISRINALKQLYAASQYNAPKRKPVVDIFLLASQQDRLVDYQCTCDIAAQWQVEFALHPTAGHDLPLDDPDWVINEINQWHAKISIKLT